MDPQNTELFKYRKTLINLYKVSFVLLILACLFILRVNILQLSTGDWLSGVFKGLLAISVPLSLILRLHFIVRPRIFSSYVLGPTKLLKRFKNHVDEIVFTKVKEVKFSFLSPRFFGGFALKMENGQKFVFLSVLKDNHQILSAIVSQNSHLVSEERLNKYTKTSKLVEISWARIISRIRKWPAMVIKYVLYPLGGSVLLSRKMSELTSYEQTPANLFQAFLIVSIFHIAIVGLINHFEEVFLNNRITYHGNQELKVDSKWEGRVYILAQVTFYVATMAIYSTFLF